MTSSQSGQSTVEFLLTGTLISGIIIRSAFLFKAELDRFNCAHIVFETTRARLEGSWRPTSATIVTIQETSDKLIGRATCGGASESVSLPKLSHQAITLKGEGSWNSNGKIIGGILPYLQGLQSLPSLE